ncbi:MAG: nucleotide exchange factor GrpE [Lachnospiraceae bacterium]|nr:nucleotide exchange factor GrpE [Lachnospiraceae bacterium]
MPDMEKEVQEQTTAETEETAEKEMDMEAASPDENQSDVKEEAEPEENAEAEGTAEEPETEGEGLKADGKKLFGKKDKKKDKAQEKIEELEDKVKRQLAEFENFRNRSEKEKTAMFETGAKSVIEKILPVIDNFERGLMAVPEDEKESPFVDGMNKIYKQMVTELEAIGVKPIEAVGLEFDPNLHNAVMQVESEEYESGVVAQELQKGYTYHDLVVRHSMVAVVQ